MSSNGLNGPHHHNDGFIHRLVVMTPDKAWSPPQSKVFAERSYAVFEAGVFIELSRIDSHVLIVWSTYILHRDKIF